MSRSRVRVIVRVVVMAVLALLMGVAGLYAHTERLMRVDADPVLPSLPLGDAQEGERLARVLGCHGCHAETLGGQVFVRVPYTLNLVASNLTEVRERYDDTAFQRLFRSGAKIDGKLAVVMPNKAFQRLRDDQIADLIAYLRSVPRVDTPLSATWYGPLARLGMLIGEYDIEPLRADAPESAAVLADRNTEDRGRHLAQVACGECHGLDLLGHPQEGTPSLQIAKAYSMDEFQKLLREGTVKSGGESASGMMSGVSRNRFVALHPHEVRALKDYLDRF